MLRYTNGTFPIHFFGGNFQSDFSFEQMFREEHYHMTLSNEKPPQAFSEVCSNFFKGQVFHKTALRNYTQGSYICLVSQIIILWKSCTRA